jgi:hypothetical protein
VLEGQLVGVQELGQLLVRTGPVERPTAVAQGQHEQVDAERQVAEMDLGLAPVDLALLARRCLEAGLALFGVPDQITQRCHEPFDRVVAAGETVFARQFLIQDAGRKLHLRCPAPQ